MRLLPNHALLVLVVLAPWHVKWGNLTAPGRHYVGLALDKLSLPKKTCWHPCGADATHEELSTPGRPGPRQRNHTTFHSPSPTTIPSTPTDFLHY